MSENTTIAIILTTVACVFGWAVWVIAVNIRRSRASRHMADLHSKLLDRFSASQDLITFLEGESGRRYFDALESDAKDPFSRILNGIQLGIILILLGASMILMSGTQWQPEARNTLLVLGVSAAALGAGFLISAIVSHRLSKSWGLLDKIKRMP